MRWPWRNRSCSIDLEFSMQPFHMLVLVTVLLPAIGDAAEPPAQTSGTVSAMSAVPAIPIELPADFRTRFAHLGSWVVTDPAAPGHGFHDVYTDAKNVEVFRKTGGFSDGAMLIKEIRAISQGTLTTGKAMWAAQPTVWFVMVKDATGQYKHSPLWGDGWVWALYKADRPGVNVATSYQADCMGCHVPAARTDHVFVEGYPTLQAH